MKYFINTSNASTVSPGYMCERVKHISSGSVLFCVQPPLFVPFSQKIFRKYLHILAIILNF